MTEENPDEIYGDLEVDDFNKLFRNPDLIEEQFGLSINVSVKLNKKTGEASREVAEDLTKVQINEAMARSGASVLEYEDTKSQFLAKYCSMVSSTS